MPRKSPYVILLREDEQQHLDHLAHSYTSPYRDVVRAKLVLLAAQGLDNDEIGQRLDLDRQIVSKQLDLAPRPGLRRQGRPGPGSLPELLERPSPAAARHRGAASAQRLRHSYRNALQVPTPVHASWLNQIEVYFSIVQRKVLSPNKCDDLLSLQQRLLEFQDYYQAVAEPFEWKFRRHDLQLLLEKLEHQQHLIAAA